MYLYFNLIGLHYSFGHISLEIGHTKISTGFPSRFFDLVIKRQVRRNHTRAFECRVFIIPPFVHVNHTSSSPTYNHSILLFRSALLWFQHTIYEWSSIPFLINRSESLHVLSFLKLSPNYLYNTIYYLKTYQNSKHKTQYLHNKMAMTQDTINQEASPSTAPIPSSPPHTPLTTREAEVRPNFPSPLPNLEINHAYTIGYNNALCELNSLLRSFGTVFLDYDGAYSYVAPLQSIDTAIHNLSQDVVKEFQHLLSEHERQERSEERTQTTHTPLPDRGSAHWAFSDRC